MLPAAAGLGALCAAVVSPRPTAPKTVGETASPTPSATVAAPQSTAAATPVSSASVRLIFGGAVMLGRWVEKRMDAHGADWPFKYVAPALQAADIAIVNLESPVREESASTEIGSLILRGEPKGIKAMADAGIDVVSLANNHITDMGVPGLRETRQLLDEHGILYTGAGEDAASAAVPAVVEKNGVRFGFLSYGYGVNIERAGIVYNRAVPETVAADVMALKQRPTW